MPRSWIPEEPAVPADQRGGGPMTLRYEDVCQDGRLVLEALPNAVGGVWRRLAQAWHKVPPGVVPILSRVVVEGGAGPLNAVGRAETDGCYELAHTEGAGGEVDRILLNLWATVNGVAGRTHPPQPANAGQPLVAGRIFAEHVFTRPFGPPEQRKVRSLELAEGPGVTTLRRAWVTPVSLLDLPEGAVGLESEATADPDATVFGLDHTDSNQHVNSLVYTRLFVEAALRRFARMRPASAPLLARSLEIAFRRPCFAGERVQLALRAFELDGQPGAVGAVISSAEAGRPLRDVKPRCYARVLFGPAG